ncbi:uncharacterized protein [Scyliorhinus torazame]|uniref:uncharacterized protein n=1 Tax=Scyliorhinus torazame TaxID=75743 RepID=UPI003B5A7B2B
MVPRRAAPRFADVELDQMLGAVEARRDVLFSRVGRRLPHADVNRAWVEVAEATSAVSRTVRTPLQCRKKMNDLVRAAREKAAHNRWEREKIGEGEPDIRALTGAEQRAMALAGEVKQRAVSRVHVAMGLPGRRAAEGYREAPNDVLMASSEEGSAHTSEDAASNLSPFLSTSEGTITSVGKPMVPDSPYGEHLHVMQVQLMGAVKDEVPESPPDFGEQAHSERQAYDEGPLMSATLSLLELQQRAGESLAELPKAISGHARMMEESLQDMSSVIGHSCERMASAMERLASAMESQIQQNTQCLLGVSANLQTVALAVSSLQPNGRHMVHLDTPPREAPPPSTESREMPSCMGSPEELQPGTQGGSHRDGLRVDRSSPAPLPATSRLQRKRPQRRLLD